MKTNPESPESTNEPVLQSIDELDVHRLSRWQDKDGRLFVVYGFGYGTDPAKPHHGNFQKTDIEMLDVHAEKINVLNYGRFLKYVIDGKLTPWHEPKSVENQTPKFLTPNPCHPKTNAN